MDRTRACVVAAMAGLALSGCIGESQFNYDTELDSRDWVGTELLDEMVHFAVRVPR